MFEFVSRVSGIPCRIRVTDWQPYDAGYILGAPEDCYPSSGGCGKWEVLDSRGRPAAWLEKKLTKAERIRIDEEAFNFMENEDDDI